MHLRKPDLTNRVHLVGVLHYQHLVDAYFAMDVFAFASLSETQGIVLIEAMASGVPVVALDAPGARDIVKDHYNGLLLKEMDIQSYVDALLWVLRCSGEESQTMKQTARATAQKYSIEGSAKRMLEVYEDARSRKSISAGKRKVHSICFCGRSGQNGIFTKIIFKPYFCRSSKEIFRRQNLLRSRIRPYTLKILSAKSTAKELSLEATSSIAQENAS